MALFEIPTRANRKQDMTIASKSKKSVKSPIAVRGDGLLGQINQIKAMVEKNLGQYKDDYIVIQNEEVLHDYITECIGNGYISIDTETMGLDPIRDKIVGICPYTYNQKGAYIPLNHVSYITNMPVPDQLSIEFVRKEFKRLLEKRPDIDMFNANFDIRVLRHSIGLDDIYCTWDGYIASKLLNENEPTHGLKALHNKYVLNGVGDAFNFDSLFKGVTFDKVPINVGYLYAAHDPVVTTELCDYQRPFLTATDKECINRGLQDVAWVFHNIEMPCINVVCDMEDTGIEFDFEYNAQLKEKYHKLLDEKVSVFNTVCEQYSEEIQAYRNRTDTGVYLYSDGTSTINKNMDGGKKIASCKLDDPINIKSSSQLAILLYDIMKLPIPVDKKTKKEVRTTNEEALKSLNHPIADAILAYREFSTIVDTFIDKLPEVVYEDNRIHCIFNQYGARTGRFSSENPNMQNIPSRNHDIRKMFIATQEEKIVNFDTDDFLEVDKFVEIFTNDEWISVSRLRVGDVIEIDGELFTISNIEESNEKVRIYL